MFMAVVRIPLALKHSALPLCCCSCFKLHFSSPAFPATFLSSPFCLTTVTARRIKRWLFSWPALTLAWNNCEIGENRSHSYLSQIDQIQWLRLLYLLHAFQKYLMLLGIIVCFLKELCIFYTIKLKFCIAFGQILNVVTWNLQLFTEFNFNLILKSIVFF